MQKPAILQLAQLVIRQNGWQVFPLNTYPGRQLLHVDPVQVMQYVIPQLAVQRPVDGL